MDTALNFLVSNLPSEFGGQRSSNRLSFQRDWTLCLLLQLHLSGKDYLVVCDYHDDVIVLDQPDTTAKIHFYQVKTDLKKRWKIADLLRRKDSEKVKTFSVLGKLYRHRISFEPVVGTLNFVSNFALNMQLSNPPPIEDRISFTIDELTSKDIDKIKAALRTELQLSDDPILDAAIMFHVTELGIRGHDTHAKGKLTEYLEKLYPSRSFPVGAIYRVIADEILRKSNVETPCTTIVDIKSLKSISRDDFERYIESCIRESDRVDPQRVASDLDSYLKSEGVLFGKQRLIRQAFEKYTLERLDNSKQELKNCILEAQKFVSGSLDKYDGKLLPLLEAGAKYLREKDLYRHVTDEYLMAITAWEVLTL